MPYSLLESNFLRNRAVFMSLFSMHSMGSDILCSTKVLINEQYIDVVGNISW